MLFLLGGAGWFGLGGGGHPKNQDGDRSILPLPPPPPTVVQRWGGRRGEERVDGRRV